MESSRNPRSKNNTKDGFRHATTPKSLRRELYAQSAVLPLESPKQFASFFDELCKELKPVGLLEEDQVATIAKLLWRKHRLQIFLDAEQAQAEFSQKASDEYDAKAGISPTRYWPEEDPKDPLVALRKLTPERHIQDLELMERLDADAERALGRLQKYQRKRMTGSLSPAAAEHRAPRWGRVRQ